MQKILPLDFQPSPGTISVCHQPSGFRTRVDGSIFQGCKKITPYYDSLIAKVICKGRNRTEANSKNVEIFRRVCFRRNNDNN